MKKIFVLFGFLAVASIAKSQTNFRSNGTGGGSWTVIGTWQVESPDGSGNWIAASSTPTSASGTIEIQANDIVTISSNLTIDQATVDPGATLTISSNTLTLTNTSDALDVNGTLTITGTGALTSPSVLALVFNGTYTHGRNGGTIPTATWNTGSFCTITGITNTVPGGLSPSGGFDTFTWNCAGQSAAINMAGNLKLINTDFIVSTTNGQQLELATTTAPTITIGGILEVDGNSKLAFVTTGSGGVINVGSDFNYNSTATSALKTSGPYTLNVSGNFNMNTTGTLELSNGANTGTMNLTGDFNLIAGTLTEASTGRGAIIFNTAGTQSFTNTGTMSNTIDVTIGASTVLDMQNESAIVGSGNLIVNGTIRLGSLNSVGALMALTTQGNIRNTVANRAYNSGSRIVYAGLAAQVIGSGHPTTAGVTTEIDNVSGVTFNAGATGNPNGSIITIPGNLILTNGNFNIDSSAGAASLTLNGNITPNTNNITITGATTDLVINGTGALGTFPFPSGNQTFRNFTLARTSSGSVTFANVLAITGTTTLTSGTVTFGGTTTLTGAVSLASGTVLAFDGQSLSMAGNFTSPGLLSASGASTLSLTGATGLTSAIGFLPANNTLQTLTINKTNASGTSVQVATALNVTNTLTMTDGTLDIVGSALNMGGGSTINFAVTGTSPSTITTSSPSGGPWNLSYSSSASVTTGFEIPASGVLTSLTSTNSGTITLNKALNIGSGGATISSGTFTSGANAISSSFFTVSAGTFTAPSTTLTLTGNLSISGTFTNNAGTVIFGGSSAQSILGTNASTTSFNSVTINNGATLTAPTTLNIQGNFVNNGTLTAGSNTVNFSGTNVQTISGSSNTQFNNFTVNKTGGSLSVNSAETITNNLTLTAGTLNITAAVSVSSASSQITLTAGTMAITSNLLTIASGATLTRAAGVISTSNPSGSGWSLIYTGATKTTGLEVPVSGNVSSVTINTNNASTVTLNQALTVTNAFTISTTGRTFTCGANNLTAGSFTSAGTFNAPTAAATTGLTLNGTLTNNGTFNNQTGTIVSAGTVTISGTVPVLNNLTISSGTFTAPAALTIQGNLINNGGTFAAGSGTITFSGNTAKQISGNTKIVFNNLTVNGGTNAADLTLENTVGADLSGILTVSASPSAVVFDTDGAGGNRIFTLLSTADKPTIDASIAVLSAGSTQLPGKITVQRYMSKTGVSTYNYQVWRDITSPVNTTVSDLQNSLPVTGNFTGQSSVPGETGSPSMYSYDETVITDTDGSGSNDLNDGWTDFPVDLSNSATTTFTKAQGYQMFIFGSDVPVTTNGNAKWSLRGTIWSGSINFPIHFTNSGPGNTPVIANDGWNLVGNPYPSTIDWKAASGWTKTNVDDAIYIDDYSTANPVFATFVNGVGTNGGTRYIATGQGFWVKANTTSPVITITENVKVPGTQTTLFREATPNNLIRITLTSSDNLTDESVIYFLDSATIGFDTRYDARKLRNQYWYLNLSSMSPVQEKYAINAMPFKNCAQVVPLDVSDVTSGTYSLSFSDFESMPSAMNIQLKDNYSNSTTDVRQNQNYPFTVDQNNASTFGSNRFSLTFTYTGTNIPITTQSPSICDTTLAQVIVKSSSVDFNYSLLSAKDGSVVGASISGTGSDLNFQVAANALVAGPNKFLVQEMNKFCASLGASSDTVVLSYLPPPVAPSVSAGISCGKGLVTLTASGAPSGGYYNWYDSLNATTPYTNQTATFVTDTITRQRTYYVSAVNSLGCEGAWAPAQANVVNLDPAVIIVTGSSTLQSNYDTGNQWYLDGTVIVGATNKTLQINQSGDYKLTVSSQGCSVSTDKEMVVTGIDEKSTDINAYPNPVKGKLTIEASGNENASGDLYNALGEHITTLNFSFDGQQQSATYNFSRESAGIYLVRVGQGDKVTVIRIVKD